MTVRTCWDADRLDLGRAFIKPDPRLMCTDPARLAGTLDWANERSCHGHVPELVRAVWGLDGEVDPGRRD